jgi:Cdc6-like AAA superfamily ATPase
LNWANKDTQTLWCPGIAGAGKTILASVIIKYLKDAQSDKEPDKKAGIACLYCEYKRREDQTLQSLLAAVLRQLVEQHTPLMASIEELYRSYLTEKIQPSFEEIFSALSEAIRSFSQVFLVVDALDECSQQSRGELLSSLQNLQKTGMKLLVTSRRTVDFRQHFEECDELEIEACECDVKAVLDDQKKKLPKCVRDDNNLWNEVKEGIVAAVDGMLVIDSYTPRCFITG